MRVQEVLDSRQARLQSFRFASIANSQKSLHFKTRTWNKERSFILNKAQTKIF